MVRSRYRPVVLLAALVPFAAGAQWSPSATLDLGMGYGQMALSQANLDNARRLSAETREAFSSPADDAPAEPDEPAFSATFDADPAVTETVNQRFILFFAGDDPDDRAVMARQVESGDYQKRFRQLMQRHGLAPRLDNLVDVTTTRYVALWEIIHGRTVTPGQARTIRSQLLAQFQDDSWMSGVDDAEKQELAETFILHVAGADIAHEELLQRQDHALLARFRAGVQQNLLPDGPRLDQLEITDDGFERR